MRAGGLSTIQQTLTAEASTVLTDSIAEAARRHHPQATPLHVAATLLATPSPSLLRRACLRSHPTTAATTHPLHSRALDLCFSVALDRLPTSSTKDADHHLVAAVDQQPSISNALVAALRRAQAHQRRGCPELQQQPLLAVKVELEQLVVSILDDPGVSRVMREAHFNSVAVKAAILEQSAGCGNNSPSVVGFQPAATVGGGTPSLLPLNRNLYINPRLPQEQQQQKQGICGGNGFLQQRSDDANKVLDILLRSKKRNPVLVGDPSPEGLMKEVKQRIERREVGDRILLRNVNVISLEKHFTSDRSQIPMKLREFCCSVEGCVIFDLGDLKWLVEGPMQQQQQIVSEMGKLLGSFDGASGRVCVIGTATCATYLRCQVYHPAMENNWDLQAVPIAPPVPVPGTFPRLQSNGILSRSVESLAHQKGFPAIAGKCPTENTDPSRRPFCAICAEAYERELAELVAEVSEKASSESKPEPRQPLPPWLQVAKSSTNQLQTKDQEQKHSTEELRKRWSETCSHLHPNSHHPKLQPPRNLSLLRSAENTTGRPASPSGSPVTTDLVLWRPNASETAVQKSQRDLALSTTEKREKSRGDVDIDIDSFKRLRKGLADKVTWQPEAASAVAAAVMRCKSGGGNRRRGDTWLLFGGSDSLGKKKMAAALSELVAGTFPVTIRLAGCDGGEDMRFRGKTALDKAAEAVRRNPFSVVVLDGVDSADALVRGNLKRAMERGRLLHSHGREVSLGSVIFIMISDASPENPNGEEKYFAAAGSGWELELTVDSGKRRRGEWWRGEDVEELEEEEEEEEEFRLTKHPRKKSACGAGLSLDLNLTAGGSDEEGSSDLTVEEHDHGRLAVIAPPLPCSAAAVAADLVELVDEAVVFKPVDFGTLRRKVADVITGRFVSVTGGGGRSLRVDDVVLDRLVGGIWFGGGAGLEEWAEKVLEPSFRQLMGDPTAENCSVIKLGLIKHGLMRRSGGGGGDWLPRSVKVVTNWMRGHNGN